MRSLGSKKSFGNAVGRSSVSSALKPGSSLRSRAPVNEEFGQKTAIDQAVNS